MATPGEMKLPGGAAPQGDGQRGALTAFDFDGTLTVRDTFTAFLRWRTSPLGWALGLLRLAPDLLAYLVHRDRGRLKGASVRVFLKGLSRAELTRDAQAFADQTSGRLLRPDALRTWAGRKAAGDTLAIVTASPEELVAPFAARLGADALIGSRLGWTAEERVGDGLAGANCRGAEKVRRLRERFGRDVALAAAYGDTAGDREMLAMAAEGHMRMFRERPARPARL